MARTMKYKIRQMLPRDFDAVMSLWRNTPGMSLDAASDSRQAIVRYLRRNPGLSLVACDGGDVVGAVLAGHDGRRGQLHHLAVATSHRKLGIGQALVARCLRSLARQHIPKCNILIFRSNLGGRKFWQSIGWKQRDDLHVFQKQPDAQASAVGHC